MIRGGHSAAPKLPHNRFHWIHQLRSRLVRYGRARCNVPLSAREKGDFQVLCERPISAECLDLRLIRTWVRVAQMESSCQSQNEFLKAAPTVARTAKRLLTQLAPEPMQPGRTLSHECSSLIVPGVLTFMTLCGQPTTFSPQPGGSRPTMKITGYGTQNLDKAISS
jgi:hypothetical protein